MDWERIITIAAGLLYIILEGPRFFSGIRRRVLKKVIHSQYADNPLPAEKWQWFKFLLKFRSALIIVFIIAGLMWLFSTEKKLTKAKNEIIQLNQEASLITDP